jgi:hypothetical protein
MTIEEAAHSTDRLFTAVLAGARWARYGAIVSNGAERLCNVSK